ncbi:MAG: hypothetical protein ACR2L9_05585 [Solirubrobacteraceae bacterium]
MSTRRLSGTSAAIRLWYPNLRVAAPIDGLQSVVLGRRLERLRGWQLPVASLGSVWLCLALWIRAKSVE